MQLPSEAVAAIHEESKVLESVLNSLRGQIEESSGRLRKEEVRTRELTSELVAARTDEDRQMLASDEAVSHGVKQMKAGEVDVLKKLLKKPYFARIVLQEEHTGRTQELEYKIGFSANPDCRIIDWRRAPVSKLYYEYKEGDEYSEEIQGRERSGKVLLRNTVEIEAENLKRLSCRHGSFIRQNGEWVLVEGSQRPHAVEAKGFLPSILSLITPEQFRTITEEAGTAILIQGIAGSGKTTVALHRLAWLLHEENSELKPDEALVIVLNNALKSFITKTLPSMEVEGVRVLTYREWARETLKGRARHLVTDEGEIRRPLDSCPASVERVKKSMALLKALEHYAAAQDQEIKAELETILATGDQNGRLRAEFQAARAKTPYGALVNDLLAALPRQPQEYGRALWLAAELEALCGRIADSEGDLLAVLGRPEHILESDQTRLMDRDIIERARLRSAANREQQVLDFADDALLLRLHELKYGSITLKDGSRGRYKHIVADEVQDMSPVELATIIGAVESTRNLTLVGDTAQKIDPSSVFPGWDKLRTQWDFKDSLARYVSLEVSHRSTLPIMQLADYVQQRQTVKNGRPGRVPLWFKCYSHSKAVGSAITWLTTAVERFPHALTAVICPDAVEAKQFLSLLKPTFGATVRIGDESSFSFAEGIVVTCVSQVKGLEFYNVLVWNVGRKIYPADDLGRNLLYVAMTRAEENLCLVSWGRQSGLLPHVDSKLVRTVEVGIEEEQQA